MPGLHLSIQLQLHPIQASVLARARAAKRRLKIPYPPASELGSVVAFRDTLATRMHEAGSTLLGFPLPAEAVTRPHFFEVVRVFLTLQAAWRDSNVEGVELLKRGFGEYLERGEIKSLKYGGTDETASQLKVADALIESVLPGLGKHYLEAWRSDLELGEFWTTDDFSDWLTMGKVCGGSCQSYDGSPYWNKSLGGPVFSLDKLAFTGDKGKLKRARVLLIPTPIEVADRMEWDLMIPGIYAAGGTVPPQDMEAILRGGIHAAGLGGCARIGVMLRANNYDSGTSLEFIERSFAKIKDEEMVVELKDLEGAVVRRERLIPGAIMRQECVIYALNGPNRFKYWDNAGGMVDSKKAAVVAIAGQEINAVKLPASAVFIDFRRIPI